MFIAYKLIQWVLFPELWIVAALLGAWALGRSEKRIALARRVLLGAILALVVLATRPAAELLIRPLESTYPPVDVRTLPESFPGQEAIVVLGGGAAWERGGIEGPSSARRVSIGSSSASRRWKQEWRRCSSWWAASARPSAAFLRRGSR